MEYFNAFWVGGLICALVQILMEKTKMMPGRIMVLLVCLGAVLGALGLYGPFSDWAKAGANVPLMGFGNNLWKGVKEMVDKEGFLGIFLGGLCPGIIGSPGIFLSGIINCAAKDEKTLMFAKFCFTMYSSRKNYTYFSCKYHNGYTIRSKRRYV